MVALFCAPGDLQPLSVVGGRLYDDHRCRPGVDMRRTSLAIGMIAVSCVLAQAAGAVEIRVFTPRAGATVLQKLQADYEKQTGDTLVITLDSGPNLVAKVERGEPCDILIAGT